MEGFNDARSAIGVVLTLSFSMDNTAAFATKRGDARGTCRNLVTRLVNRDSNLNPVMSNYSIDATTRLCGQGFDADAVGIAWSPSGSVKN
jgi:hypothetical protein